MEVKQDPSKNHSTLPQVMGNGEQCSTLSASLATVEFSVRLVSQELISMTTHSEFASLARINQRCQITGSMQRVLQTAITNAKSHWSQRLPIKTALTLFHYWFRDKVALSIFSDF